MPIVGNVPRRSVSPPPMFRPRLRPSLPAPFMHLGGMGIRVSLVALVALAACFRRERPPQPPPPPALVRIAVLDAAPYMESQIMAVLPRSIDHAASARIVGQDPTLPYVFVFRLISARQVLNHLSVSDTSITPHTSMMVEYEAGLVGPGPELLWSHRGYGYDRSLPHALKRVGKGIIRALQRSGVLREIIAEATASEPATPEPAGAVAPPPPPANGPGAPGDPPPGDALPEMERRDRPLPSGTVAPPPAPDAPRPPPSPGPDAPRPATRRRDPPRRSGDLLPIPWSRAP